VTALDVDMTFSTLDAQILTGASLRQLNRYATMGVAGTRPGRGGGNVRVYTPTDIEVVAALQDLLALGAPIVQLADEVAYVLGARPVQLEGEYLIVTLDPSRARRFDRYLLDELTAGDAPMWVVRLRSFTAVASTSPGLPAGGGVDGAAGSHAAPPQLPPPGGSIP
jgi:hypothetical protein